MLHYYYTNETINQFEISYMINPSLNYNKVFRVKVEEFSSVSFAYRKMETIRYFLKNKNTCVVALIIIYEKNGGNEKMYRALSCVFIIL